MDAATDEAVKSFEPKSGKWLIAVALGLTVAAEIVAAVFGFLIAMAVVSWTVIVKGPDAGAHFWTVWGWSNGLLMIVYFSLFGVLLALCWDIAHRLEVPTTVVLEAWWAEVGSIEEMRDMNASQLKAGVLNWRSRSKRRRYLRRLTV